MAVVDPDTLEVPIEIIEPMHSAVKILFMGQETWGTGLRTGVPIRSDAAAAHLSINLFWMRYGGWVIL